MKPFAKVDLDAARWMLRRTTYTETPPDAICQLELAAALVGGDLPSWSHREWADRWHCSPWKVRKHAEAVANQYPTTDQPRTNQYPTTLRQCFPHLSTPLPTKTNQKPTRNQPTNARLPYEKKREEVEVEEQQAPQAAPDDLQELSDLSKALKAEPSPKQVETDQGIACLRTLRDEYLRGQGKKASSWGKAKGTQKRVGRFLTECRARADELEATPLEALEALGRWVFGAPDAQWLRQRSSPLEQALGGPAGDDSTRMARAKDALAWVAGGQSAAAKPPQRREKQTGWLDRLSEKQTGAPAGRTVINQPLQIVGGRDA